MTARRLLAVPAALACASVLVPTTAAVAAEPDRSGWWNRASAGGVAAPAPTAAAGDLRVAALGRGEPAAYAAVLYPAPDATSATLDVQLRSLTGTPEVVACPTTTTDWADGGNQPYDKAPPYDCTAGLAFGSLGEDGKTLSFQLDSSTQSEPGVWSLALVPQPGSGAGPFTVDIVAPGPQAFQAEPAPPTSTGAGDVSTGTPPPEGPSADSSGEVLLSDGFVLPPGGSAGSAALPPLVAGGAAPAAPAAPVAPTVAGAAGAPAPFLLARPAGVIEDVGAGRRLLALLVLAGGSAAVGYAAGQQRPGPRLIGGRSRLAVPAEALGSSAPTVPERPRGIGRFAKTRDAAPRRLL